MKIKITFCLLVLLLSGLPEMTSAQVSFYDFNTSTEVYTELTSGTVVATATAGTGAAAIDDVVYTVANGTITFPFKFDNITSAKKILKRSSKTHQNYERLLQ